MSELENFPLDISAHMFYVWYMKEFHALLLSEAHRSTLPSRIYAQPFVPRNIQLKWLLFTCLPNVLSSLLTSSNCSSIVPRNNSHSPTVPNSHLSPFACPRYLGVGYFSALFPNIRSSFVPRNEYPPLPPPQSTCLPVYLPALCSSGSTCLPCVLQGLHPCPLIPWLPDCLAALFPDQLLSLLYSLFSHLNIIKLNIEIFK
jgi:hypothetical protein